MTTGDAGGAFLIATERSRQIDVEGFSAEHDAEHPGAELASAAIAYAIHAWWEMSETTTGWTRAMVDEMVLEQWWPWDATEWKPDDDPQANLIKAGALLAAEIDRRIAAQS